MKMKKALGLLLAGTMVLSLVACGGSGDGGSSDGGDSKEEAKSDGGSTLKVAAVETAYGASMWEKVCEAFEASHDGVTVELTIDKKLEDVIDPDMKAGNFPDVILRAVGGEKALTETFVKDNNLTELTDVLDMTVPGEDVKVEIGRAHV